MVYISLKTMPPCCGAAGRKNKKNFYILCTQNISAQACRLIGAVPPAPTPYYLYIHHLYTRKFFIDSFIKYQRNPTLTSSSQYHIVVDTIFGGTAPCWWNDINREFKIFMSKSQKPAKMNMPERHTIMSENALLPRTRWKNQHISG